MPLSRDQLAALEPPDGWQLRVRPTLRTAGYIGLDLNQGLSPQNAGNRLSALVKRAKDNGLGLRAQIVAHAALPGVVMTQFVRMGYYEVRFPMLFRVSANHPEQTDETFGHWTCICGRKECDWTDPVCNECARIACEYCGLGFVKLHKLTTKKGAAVL